MSEPEFDFGQGRIAQRFEHVEEIEGPGGALTALEAFEVVKAMSEAFDDSGQLIKVQSGPGVDQSGRCSIWIFSYQFPERWCTGSFLVKTGSAAPGGNESITFQVEPFPSPGSAMAKMMNSGQSGFVEQQWKMELERSIALPQKFHDSSEAMKLWQKEGLNLELTPTVRLQGLVPPLGGPIWRLADPESGRKKSLAEAAFH